MRTPLLAMLALTLTLSACAAVRESRFNPLNWFGQSEARAARSVPADAYAPIPDPRPLVDQVIAMAVEPIPGGAILRATGLPPTQGFWDAELVPVEGTEEAPVEDGLLVFDFRIWPPPYVARAGTQPSREVEVATYLTLNDLEGVTRIVVRGARTERVTRR
jgi:hypothetical protein